MRYGRVALPLLLVGTLSTNVALLLRPEAAPRTDRDMAQGVSRALRAVSEQVSPAVVSISTRALRGSGVLLSSDGLIVTNHHVVQHFQRCRVELSDGRSLTARVVGSDPDTDIALVHVEGDGFSAVEVSDDPPPGIGTWVLAFGNPMGLSHSVTFGIVSARGREANLPDIIYEDFLQTDAAINAGNSGGPLIDLDGKLIGINTAKEVAGEFRQGLGFAIPAYMVKEVVAELLEKGHVERGWFGISVVESRTGVIVESITTGSPADDAGFRALDLVVGIDGAEVANRRALFAAIAGLAPGSTVDVDVVRDETRVVLPVRVGTRPMRNAHTSLNE